MPASALEYVRHMLEESDFLLANSRALTKDRFIGDETLKRAFVRSLEIVGEASKQVPQDLKDRYPQVA